MVRLLVAALSLVIVTGAQADTEGFVPARSIISPNSDWLIPRTEHGQPNLQGTWFFGSRTPLQRPKNLGEQLTYTEQEVEALERGMQKRLDEQATPLDPNRGAPEEGSVIRQEADDSFLAHYVKPKISQIAGEYRTSVITDPSDGRIPSVKEGFNDFYSDRGELGLNASDGPEGQPLSGRCLIFGAALPNLTPIMMNPNLQIVQNKDYVMVMTEMAHDARIIRLGDEHFNDGIDRWMGDSVGFWEGDTLVVHSRGFRPEQSSTRMGFRVSDDFEVTERYTLTSDDTIHYAFTVIDEQAYGRPISGERTLTRNPPEERLYPFECHEGNYSLGAILRGARMDEVRAEFEK